jgi:acyl phosphate:glycerol-3-phosphate acyltransferase
MSPALVVLAAAAIGYLLGSIPFGLVITKFAGTQDIRTIGSGNIGATNVLRTGNKLLAALTLLGDMLKGTLAVMLAGQLFGAQATLVSGINAAMIAGFFAFLGHLFPVWLKFKGGKGVATYIGVTLGLLWPAAVIYCVVWAAVAASTRYSSVAALSASLLVPAFVWAQGFVVLGVMLFVMTALIWYMHRGNIQRLIDGTESRIGEKA